EPGFAPVQPGTLAGYGGEPLAVPRHLDHPGDHRAVHLRGDGHRPVAQAVQVVDGSVQRVDDPAHPPRLARVGAIAGRAARGLAALLAENGIAGTVRAY